MMQMYACSDPELKAWTTLPTKGLLKLWWRIKADRKT